MDAVQELDLGQANLRGRRCPRRKTHDTDKILTIQTVCSFFFLRLKEPPRESQFHCMKTGGDTIQSRGNFQPWSVKVMQLLLRWGKAHMHLNNQLARDMNSTAIGPLRGSRPAHNFGTASRASMMVSGSHVSHRPSSAP